MRPAPAPATVAAAVATLVCAALALASAARADAPFQRDSERYPSEWLIPRTAKDLLAAPANVVTWDATDYAAFGVLTGATVSLMWPAEPSGDVRFQRWVLAHPSPLLDATLMHVNTVWMTLAIGTFTGVTFGTAWLTDDCELYEYGELMLEALAVTQFYHATSKLLLGREGPHQGNHQGEIHGPVRWYFPGGTPSGHAASVVAISTVAAEYWDSWPLRILSLALGVYVSTSLVHQNSHFVSDVIWGAGLGFYVGRWVVKHRSSRYRYGESAEPSRIAWAPILVGQDGLGLSAFGEF